MFLTYDTLWLYYCDTHVVFSYLLFEEEIGIRSFSHPCPLLLPGNSFTPTGNYPFDIAKDFQILTVLSISLSPKLKRFCGAMVIAPLVLLWGWPPRKNHCCVLSPCYSCQLLKVWQFGSFLGLVSGTGSTT